MKYNFKNCSVVINAGTEVLKIDGIEKPNGAGYGENYAEAMAGITIQKTYEDYGVFMANLDAVKIGDRVKVPAVEIGADFEDIEVRGEYATVYDIEGEQIHFVFDRALFQSAIDENNTKAWADTQLARYLHGAFLDALRKETSAVDCGLLRKEELWGDNAKPFFKNGKNRVCFDKDEDYSVWYWTEMPEIEEASIAYFWYVYHGGNATFDSASYAYYYVRPRFIILKS